MCDMIIILDLCVGPRATVFVTFVGTLFSVLTLNVGINDSLIPKLVQPNIDGRGDLQMYIGTFLLIAKCSE